MNNKYDEIYAAISYFCKSLPFLMHIVPRQIWIAFSCVAISYCSTYYIRGLHLHIFFSVASMSLQHYKVAPVPVA